jgi:hypothetical protein
MCCAFQMYARFADRPATEAYVTRASDRPFKKARADQIAHFAAADRTRAEESSTSVRLAQGLLQPPQEDREFSRHRRVPSASEVADTTRWSVFGTNGWKRGSLTMTHLPIWSRVEKTKSAIGPADHGGVAGCRHLLVRRRSPSALECAAGRIAGVSIDTRNADRRRAIDEALARAIGSANGFRAVSQSQRGIRGALA